VPFAGYRDFADCVAKNRDKKDPDAYCAEVQRRSEKRCTLCGAVITSEEAMLPHRRLHEVGLL
jgi:hypothetical protein